ncbi:MAG: polysaccharide deacetylase family protein [Calditrichaceae bacterium]
MSRIIKLIISVIYRIILVFGRLLLLVFGKKPKAVCTILYYHEVTDAQRIKFARQMDDLVRFCQPVKAGTVDSQAEGKYFAGVTFDDGFKNIAKNALPELIKRKIPATIFIPVNYLGRKPEWDGEYYDDIIMTKDELLELPGDLVTIGSHTLSHPELTKTDARTAKTELFESRSILESMLGKKVKLFSFPYGGHNTALIDLALQAGYDRVFTIEPHRAIKTPDEKVTGRVWTSPDDWWLEFRLKLLGYYSWLPAYYSMRQLIFKYSYFNIFKFRGDSGIEPSTKNS